MKRTIAISYITQRKIHHISDIKRAIIMLCNSYGAKTMKNKREIHIATATNP
jgi:hypothetical protein